MDANYNDQQPIESIDTILANKFKRNKQNNFLVTCYLPWPSYRLYQQLSVPRTDSVLLSILLPTLSVQIYDRTSVHVIYVHKSDNTLQIYSFKHCLFRDRFSGHVLRACCKQRDCACSPVQSASKNMQL